MIKYEIEGGNLPVVICYPEAGQTLCTEGGAMSWMSPNIKMDTNSGGGIKKALGRMFAGEKIFTDQMPCFRVLNDGKTIFGFIEAK